MALAVGPMGREAADDDDAAAVVVVPIPNESELMLIDDEDAAAGDEVGVATAPTTAVGEEASNLSRASLAARSAAAAA